MSQLRPGLPPARVQGALSRPAALLVTLACLALGACSTTGATTQPVSYYRAPVGAQIGAYGPPVEIEDDGIEAQRAPHKRVHEIPDDPTQPYSPNYGAVLDPMNDAPAYEHEPDDEPSWEPIVKPASIG